MKGNQSMSQLTNFTYGDQPVRTALIDSEPHFVLRDLCNVLEIAQPVRVAQSLDSDEVTTTHVTDTLGRAQDTYVVTEAGMYSLVLRSRKPEAKAFKRWITHEVLPAIRKTGAYGGVAELTRSDLARMVLDSESAREAAEHRVKSLEPAAEAWGVMVSASGDYSVDEAAKILSRDPGIEIGRTRLFNHMAGIGWLYRSGKRQRWHAYQSQVDNGRLVMRMSAAFLNARTGEMENPAPTIRITAQGLEKLRASLTTVVPTH